MKTKQEIIDRAAMQATTTIIADLATNGGRTLSGEHLLKINGISAGVALGIPSGSMGDFNLLVEQIASSAISVYAGWNIFKQKDGRFDERNEIIALAVQERSGEKIQEETVQDE